MDCWPRYGLLLMIGMCSVLGTGCAGSSPLSWLSRDSSSSTGPDTPAAISMGQAGPRRGRASSTYPPNRLQRSGAADPVRLSSDPGPLGPELYLHAARLHEQQGDGEAAAQQYRKALELQPQEMTLLVRYARFCDRQDQLDQAVQAYRRAIDAHPQSPLPHNDLGLCYARHGQLDQAVQSLTRAVELQPDQPRYRNNLATVLVVAGRSPEAHRHLASVHPPAVAHYNLSVLLARHGDHQQARQHLDQALEHDPSWEPARAMRQQLSRPTDSDRQAHREPPRQTSSPKQPQRLLPPVVEID